jgi:DNA polymerase/3'-5' exonuclease PolX
MTLNEYGLARVEGGAAGERHQEEIYALGLDWIPPELREFWRDRSCRRAPAAGAD